MFSVLVSGDRGPILNFFFSIFPSLFGFYAFFFYFVLGAWLSEIFGGLGSVPFFLCMTMTTLNDVLNTSKPHSTCSFHQCAVV